MQEEALEQQIQDVQDHLKVLLQHEERGPDHPAEQSRSIENVSVALEELSVAAEEMRQQNEQLLVMRDVVEAERQRYRELFDFAPDGYLVTDSKGVIQEANTAAAVLLNVPQNDLPGKPLILYVAKTDRQPFYNQLNQLLNLNELRDWELLLQNRHGTTFPAVLAVSTAFDPQGKVIGLRWLMRDISRLKEAEVEKEGRNQELRILSRRLVEVQEAERRHIARELHDEMGQTLTGLKMLLSVVCDLPGVEEDGRVQAAQTMIDELLDQVRNLSLDLRPSLLDDLGLLPALAWLCQSYEEKTGVRVTFEHSDLDHRFNSAVETAVYRIAQESLTNIARHAATDQAILRVRTDPDNVYIHVEDQGVGFDDQAALSNHPSGGLSGMRERVALLDGRLQIKAAPSAGTTVIATIPLQINETRRQNGG